MNQRIMVWWIERTRRRRKKNKKKKIHLFLLFYILYSLLVSFLSWSYMILLVHLCQFFLVLDGHFLTFGEYFTNQLLKCIYIHTLDYDILLKWFISFYFENICVYYLHYITLLLLLLFLLLSSFLSVHRRPS